MLKKLLIFLGKLLCFLVGTAFVVGTPLFIQWAYYENMPGPDLDYYVQLARADQYYDWYTYKYPYARTKAEVRKRNRQLKIVRRWFEAEFVLDIDSLPIFQQDFAYTMKYATRWKKPLVYTKEPHPKTFKNTVPVAQRIRA